MPTDLVELGIAGSCIAGMSLARSGMLAPRDGLDTSALAAVASAAITLVLIVVNSVAFVLSAALPFVLMPLLTLVCGAAVTSLLALAVKKIAGAALQRLIMPMAPAIFAGVLLMCCLCTLIAPSQHLLHAALGAVGAGFSLAVLLQLCALLDTALAIAAARYPSTLTSLRQPQYQHALTLLIAAVVTITVIAAMGRW